jgi:hypothetical protein
MSATPASQESAGHASLAAVESWKNIATKEKTKPKRRVPVTALMAWPTFFV